MSNKHNGLRTAVWGPPGWIFLHCITFGYPVNPEEYDKKHGYPIGSTRRRYLLFFHLIAWVLPCRICRENYMDNITAIPVEEYLDSRTRLVKWLYLLHNRVNKHLKKRYTISLKQVKKRYEKYRAKCKPSNKKEEKIRGSKTGCVIPVGNKKYKCNIVITEDNESVRIVGGKIKKSKK